MMRNLRNVLLISHSNHFKFYTAFIVAPFLLSVYVGCNSTDHFQQADGIIDAAEEANADDLRTTEDPEERALLRDSAERLKRIRKNHDKIMRMRERAGDQTKLNNSSNTMLALVSTIAHATRLPTTLAYIASNGIVTVPKYSGWNSYYEGLWHVGWEAADNLEDLALVAERLDMIRQRHANSVGGDLNPQFVNLFQVPAEQTKFVQMVTFVAGAVVETLPAIAPPNRQVPGPVLAQHASRSIEAAIRFCKTGLGQATCNR